MFCQCAENLKKTHPGVLIDTLEKCWISGASAGCAQINWWLNAQNKIWHPLVQIKYMSQGWEEHSKKSDSTCANVVHVLGKCRKPDKTNPGVWVNGLGKCGIYEASLWCTQLIWWVNILNTYVTDMYKCSTCVQKTQRKNNPSVWVNVQENAKFSEHLQDAHK